MQTINNWKTTPSVATIARFLLLGLFIPLIFSLVSLIFRKDVNWDLKNYHYYNAYAFLEDRLNYDIAPAQMQTYFNPLLDLPFFLLSKHLSAPALGLLFGFIHGLNLSLVFLIFERAFKSQNPVKNYFVGISLIIIACTGPGFLSELGGTMNDNLISLFVLLSIYSSIISSSNFSKGNIRKGYIQVCLAGLIMGIAMGFKLTAGIFALCSGLLLPLLFVSPKIKLRTFFAYGSMGVLGFVIVDGFWLWRLYMDFANPFFPYFNNIFQSPLSGPWGLQDQRFLPKAFYEYFFWPIISTLNSYRINEMKFFDLRFAFFYLFLLVYLVSIIHKLVARHQNNPSLQPVTSRFDTRIGNYLIAFLVSSYILWMVQFSIYRYIIPLELLIPLCSILVLDRLIRNRGLMIAIITISLFLGAVGYKSFNWGRTQWATPYIKVDTSLYKPDESGVVVMLGAAPTSYVIPEFPKLFRFIRPQSNFMHTYQTELHERIHNIIDSTTYPIYILFSKSDTSIDLPGSLQQLGLALNQSDCYLLTINIPDDLLFCKVNKSSDS